MKKIISLFLSCLCLCITIGCDTQENTENSNVKKEEETKQAEMQIVVEGQEGHQVIFQLHASKAAQTLYDQLPITIEVENYSDNEKIFYPKEALDTSDAQLSKGPAGTLAYYEPWGNVVMYYGNCNGADGLYGLGEAVDGVEQIKHLSGSITIRKLEPASQQGTEDHAVKQQHEEKQKESDAMHQLNIIIEDTTFSASLYDNEAAHAFMDVLPITLTMNDLHSNEKYYYFDASFPSAAQPVSNIQAGDIKLFGNDCLVLFYKDFPTSYSYTSLGKIEDAQGLLEAVGTGSVTVRFEKAE